ncbi:MAG: hypothetical protein ACREYF_19490 [Gammaproteobacteria bacterium]
MDGDRGADDQRGQGYPTWVSIKFKEREGSVALDKIRAVDKIPID